MFPLEFCLIRVVNHPKGKPYNRPQVREFGWPYFIFIILSRRRPKQTLPLPSAQRIFPELPTTQSERGPLGSRSGTCASEGNSTAKPLYATPPRYTRSLHSVCDVTLVFRPVIHFGNGGSGWCGVRLVEYVSYLSFWCSQFLSDMVLM